MMTARQFIQGFLQDIQTVRDLFSSAETLADEELVQEARALVEEYLELTVKLTNLARKVKVQEAKQ